MIKFKNQNLIFMLLIAYLCSVSINLSAKESMSECVFNTDDVTREVLGMLFIQKRDSSGDFDSVIDFINSKVSCVKNRFEGAVYNELVGWIWTHKYRFTREPRHAQIALKFFQDGLALKTRHDPHLLWRTATLLEAMGKYEEAISYMNKVLSVEHEKPGIYLSKSLDLAVAIKDWETARKLVDVLFNLEQQHFAIPRTLRSAVKTLCYYGQFEAGKKFLAYSEKNHQIIFNEEEVIMEEVRAILFNKSCQINNGIGV